MPDGTPEARHGRPFALADGLPFPPALIEDKGSVSDDLVPGTGCVP